MKLDHTFIQPRPQPVTLPPDAQIEQQIPQRPATVHSDVGVPFLQALITGSVTSALLAVLAWEITGYSPWRTFLILTLAITSAVWLVLLGETRRLLWGIERATGLDLNGDGKRGDPEKRRLEVELKTGGSTLFVGSDWLEIDDDKLLMFALSVVSKKKLTEGDLGTNKAIFSGMPEWRKFRSKLLSAGLMRYVNPDATNLGYELTPAGRSIFGRLAQEAQEQGYGRGRRP